MTRLYGLFFCFVLPQSWWQQMYRCWTCFITVQMLWINKYWSCESVFVSESVYKDCKKKKKMIKSKRSSALPNALSLFCIFIHLFYWMKIIIYWKESTSCIIPWHPPLLRFPILTPTPFHFLCEHAHIFSGFPKLRSRSSKFS